MNPNDDTNLTSGSDPEATATSMLEDATQQLADFATARPMAAMLASAAAGAAVIALLALAAREPKGPVGKAAKRLDDAPSDYKDLKAQITDLVSKLTASIPSKSQAADAVDSVRDATADSWSDLKDKAQSALSQWQPQVGAAVDFARSNPLWTSVAAGAIGAVLGAQLLGSKKPD